MVRKKDRVYSKKGICASYVVAEESGGIYTPQIINVQLPKVTIVVQPNVRGGNT